MRKIQPPPLASYSVWGDLAKSGRLEAVRGPLVDGKYLHWHELVRRTPPAGLTHEEWWQALKFHRASAKDLPLKDQKGVPFRFMLLDQILEQLHLIDFQAGGTVELPAQITNPDTRDRYYISSLIEEAITSSQIEGASTTRQVARDMLRKGRPPRDTSEKMILNNFLTMQRMRDLKNRPLDPALILEIHRLVSEGTLQDPKKAGAWRSDDDNVYIADSDANNVYVPPPAEQIPERMALLCDFANEKIPSYFVHPALRSMILHFWLAYEHPFVDGNGRTARALFYWSMLRHGYWLFEFVSISHTILRHRSKYDLAYLFSESDGNDLTYFLLFHTDVLQEALNDLRDYLTRKSAQVKEAEAELKALYNFNHRQKALLSHALRHPGADYTVESHRKSHNVRYDTARLDLLRLEEKGLLLKSKLGKAFVYQPHPNLAEKLKQPA